MDGYQYEKKCAELLKAKGFSNVQVTPGSGDQGIDVIGHQSGKKYGVQCKYYEGTVGNKAVQEVYAGAAYYSCDVALIITSSTLTKPAKELARKLQVEVWENIDAIYLQKHTAEYIKQEKERQREERERAQQLWKSREKERKQEEARKLIESKKIRKDKLMQRIEYLNREIVNCDSFHQDNGEYFIYWIIGFVFLSVIGAVSFSLIGGILLGFILSTCIVIQQINQNNQKIKDKQQNRKKELEKEKDRLEIELSQLNKDLANIK